jgi:YidC/Oxa1 family membrane protein insertase
LVLAAGALTVSAAPLPGQQGLPLELTIQDQPSLNDQVKTLQDMMVWVQASQPQAGGIMDKLKGLVGGGGSKAPLINLSTLADAGQKPQALQQMNGKLIAVQGLLQLGKDPSTGILASDVAGQVSCRLSLGAAMAKEGLPAKLDWLPVRAEGLAQVEANGKVTVTVAKLTPAPALVALRLGRIYEVLGEQKTAGAYQAAVDYYRAAMAPGPTVYDFSPFAGTEAGHIAADPQKLNNAKVAVGLYNAAWTAYNKQVNGQPLYFTWERSPDGGDWKRLAVGDAIAGPLKLLVQDGFWYKLVDSFVMLCGGSAAWGLLLLAVATRVLVYPLTKKQLASARDMQRLQPMMKSLQEKHKGDKQKFQEEFWKLCQEHGVNPLGGCLPMVVQMPLLYFVYMGVRAYMPNLGGQSFLWVHSLAQPDIALLIIYTVSQVAFGKVTQQQNPSAAMDPQQKQQQQMMTYMMPVMFFFLFQSFPAAFMLYWLGTNVAYLGQTLWYNHTATPLDVMPTKGSGQGSWLSRLTGSLSKPEDGAGSDSSSYEERKAAAEGKLTNKADADKKRKKKRWNRTRPGS